MRSVLRSRGAARAPQEPRRFYSVAEVARILGTSEMTVRRAIHAGEFPAVRIRGRFIVPAKVLDDIAEAALTAHAVVDAADWVASGGVAQ